MQPIRNFARDTKATTAVEYALIASAIGIAVYVGFGDASAALADSLTMVGNLFSDRVNG